MIASWSLQYIGFRIIAVFTHRVTNLAANRLLVSLSLLVLILILTIYSRINSATYSLILELRSFFLVLLVLNVVLK